MMKSNLFYTALIGLSASLLSGCNDDKAPETTTPAVLQGIVYAFDVDEAGVQWKNNQMIGVTMLKANTTEVVEPYQNITYTTTAFPVGYFTPVAPDDVLNYPEDGSQVDLIAYYPYQWKIKENKIPVNVSDQKAKTKFDLIYANNCKGLSKENKKTKLELRPVVSEVTIKLEAGDGVNDTHLANAVITLTGMPTANSFNLLTGSFEDATDVQNITLPALPVAEGNGAKGYTLPAVSTEGYKVRIDLPSMANRVEIREIAELFPVLESGTRYTAVARVSLTKIEFINVTQEPIKDWEEGDKIAGNGTQLLIRPISALAAGDLPAYTGGNFFGASKIETESWFKLTNAATVICQATVQTDATQNRNVIFLSHTGGDAGWFQSVVGYRMSQAYLSNYTVKFTAKGTGKISCFIRTSTGKCPLLTTIAGTKYPTYKENTLTSDYTEYSVSFNLSRVGTGRGSYLDDATDATLTDYNDFYIGFHPTAAGTTAAPSNFYLDNVTLTKN